MLNRPELVQFGDLTPEHFQRFPVWAACHTFDYEEEWYDDTDEETFRPWTGPLPVDPAEGMFLVRAEIAFQDGSKFPGFVTPEVESSPPLLVDMGMTGLGITQPHVFMPDGKVHGFWNWGRTGDDRTRFYEAFERSSANVFPARFAAQGDTTQGNHSGEIEGFYVRTDSGQVNVQI